MQNNRCWFRSSIRKDETFKWSTIDIQIDDFYRCLKESVQKPLGMSLRFSPGMNTSAANDDVAASYAKDCMHQLKRAIVNQAEQFFEEFYHYNIADMTESIKHCIDQID